MILSWRAQMQEPNESVPSAFEASKENLGTPGKRGEIWALLQAGGINIGMI